MKTSYIFSLILSCLLLVFAPCSAQKSVLGKPERLTMPPDVFDSPSKYEKLLNDTRNKSRSNAWLVISDRDDNPVYERNNYDSKKKGYINFKEYFYVIDETEGWVKIATARVDKLKIKELRSVKGWVPKKNLLLWSSGIVNPNTAIHKKALLLHRIEDTEAFNEKKVDYFRHSNLEEKYKEPEGKALFSYFFILKKENDRLLLCEEAQLSPYNIKDKVVGWVDSRKLQEWSTRICLEPNFIEAGFQERKNNDYFLLRAFIDNPKATSYSQGFFEPSQVYWEQDPCFRKGQEGDAYSRKSV